MPIGTDFNVWQPTRTSAVRSKMIVYCKRFHFRRAMTRSSWSYKNNASGWCRSFGSVQLRFYRDLLYASEWPNKYRFFLYSVVPSSLVKTHTQQQQQQNGKRKHLPHRNFVFVFYIPVFGRSVFSAAVLCASLSLVPHLSAYSVTQSLASSHCVCLPCSNESRVKNTKAWNLHGIRSLGSSSQNLCMTIYIVGKIIMRILKCFGGRSAKKCHFSHCYDDRDQHIECDKRNRSLSFLSFHR